MSAETPEGPESAAVPEGDLPPRRRGDPRKAVLLRLNPRLHEALERWARDDLRSLNAQIEFLLTDAVRRHRR